MRTAIVRNNRGLTLIEVLFALMISAVAFLTLNVFITQINLENKKLSENFNTMRKNYDFLEMLNNPNVWKATVLDVNNYAYFSCKLGLAKHPDAVGVVNCDDVNGQFRLVGSDKSIAYDQNETDKDGRLVGYTAEGQKCYGFDAVKGNDSCPVHYEITWTLPCLIVGASSCKEPMASISVKQINKYATRTELNATKSYSMNINLPRGSDLVPRDSSVMIGINSTSKEFDIINTEYKADTFNLKIVEATSSGGSTVSISDNKIRYTPKPNFYGVDKIRYKLERSLFDKISSAEAIIWVKVMTPFTWVGDGPVDDTNLITGSKWNSIYNKKNWCGKVVDGKCTYFSELGSDPNLTYDQLRQGALVFNELCNSCNVLVKATRGAADVQVSSIEMMSSFKGMLKQVDDINIKVLRSAINRNSDDPSLAFAFEQRGGTFIGANSKATEITDEVVAVNKSFSISSDLKAVALRSITRTDGSFTVNAFAHLFVDAGKFYASEQIHLRSGYNWVNGASVFYPQSGRVTVYGRYGGGNFFDGPGVSLNDFAFQGNGQYDYSVVGDLNVRNLLMYQTGTETQLRGKDGANTGHIYVSGNIYLHGSGGRMINGWTGWGYAYVIVNGGADQYIYSNMDLNGNKDRTQIGRLPNLVVNKPSGVLHIKGDLGITSAFDYQRGDLQFYDDEEKSVGDKQFVEMASTWNEMSIKNSSGKELVFPNFEIASTGSYMRFDTDFRVKGDFVQHKCKYDCGASGYPMGPSTRTIFIEGDIYIRGGYNEWDLGGLVLLNMVGTGNQKIVGVNTGKFFKNNVSNLTAATLGVEPTITTNVGEPAGYLPDVEVNKTTGNLTLEGNIGFNQKFKVNRLGGTLNAENASLSYINANGYGNATIDLAGVTPKYIKIKSLNTFRALSLMGGTVEITDGLNLPNNQGIYNRGVIYDGEILLNGNLYYNAEFDRQTTVVTGRAVITMNSSKPGTIYATMPTDSSRIGSMRINMNKLDGSSPGNVTLNCQGYAGSTFYPQWMSLYYTNFKMENCSMKVYRTLQLSSSGPTGGPTLTPYSALIDRGSAPGELGYGFLKNDGKITPEGDGKVAMK